MIGPSIIVVWNSFLLIQPDDVHQTRYARTSIDMDGTLKLGRGDSKTPIALLRPNIFFWKKVWKYFPEGIIKCDFFHTHVENSVNSVICFFWALLQAAQIGNSSKNVHVWAALKASSTKLNIFFSLERSWCEYFELCYGLSTYHLPPSSPGELLKAPPSIL